MFLILIVIDDPSDRASIVVIASIPYLIITFIAIYIELILYPFCSDIQWLVYLLYDLH